jgi:hypothetical protein
MGVAFVVEDAIAEGHRNANVLCLSDLLMIVEF